MFTRTQYFLRVKFRDLILMWDNWLVFCVKMLVCTIWLIFIQFFCALLLHSMRLHLTDKQFIANNLSQRTEDPYAVFLLWDCCLRNDFPSRVMSGKRTVSYKSLKIFVSSINQPYLSVCRSGNQEPITPSRPSKFQMLKQQI